jgi:hypothetical protein
LQAGYKGPQQVKSQIAAVRAQKGEEMSSYDKNIAKSLSPRGHEEEEEESYQRENREMRCVMISDKG